MLSSLALDSLKAEENIPWGQRFKRMLFDTDTRQVLIMTILCLIAMVCCHNIDSLPGKLFLFAAAIVWLISAYQFVKETKLLLYLLNFTVMTLIEQAIPTPELTGLLPVLLMVVTMALRILLFSFVALQIGYIYYAQEIHSASKDPSQKTIVDKVTETAYDMSILETGLAAVHLYTNRKQIAKKAAVRLKDKALDKLLGSKK